MLTLISQDLTTILRADQSSFLRILVADTVRELLIKGAERAAIAKSPFIRKIVENLPLSKTGDSKWMGETVSYLDQLRATRPVPGQYAECSLW
jgi:hypothetical protein